MKLIKTLIAVTAAALIGTFAFAADAFNPGELWEATEYVKPYGEKGAKIAADKAFGKVTAGKNIKAVAKGNGIGGTIAKNTVGYVQVSNGDAGSLKFTVKAGTRKITIAAKAAGGKAFVVKAGKNVLLKANEVCKSGNYENIILEKNFAEDTEITITGDNTTCNIKAILVE